MMIEIITFGVGLVIGFMAAIGIREKQKINKIIASEKPDR
jgi:hypothetical protein